MAHTSETIESMKRAPGPAGMVEVILNRWSPRAFADRDVSSDDVKKIFEAARWAASSYNEQPWRFLVGHRGSESYTKIFDALVEANRLWAQSAPVLILSVAKKHFTHSGDRNLHSWHDVGWATAQLSLEATALGLHTHSMAGFDPAQARASFRIPEEFDPVAVTAVGYLGDASGLPEMLKKMEESPRQRKALREFVYSDWEKAAEL